jgi:CheY-like chemotaxis protein
MAMQKRPILIVEDDPDIREILQQLLEMEGYTVITANNGLEALSLLQTATNPCLILLDLFMPVMNGAQFLESLEEDRLDARRKLEKDCEIPIVILSAAPPQGEVVKSVVPKTSGFIRKPVDLDHFLKVVKGFCCSQQISV